MKKSHSFYSIVILFSLGNLEAIVWFGDKNENCQYVHCEGEDCPREEEICPYKLKMNTTNDDITPLAMNWPVTVSKVDLNRCEIGNHSQRRLKSIECSIGNTLLPCDKPLPPGTFVTYKCPNMYNPAGILPMCQKNGKWSEPILCIPECGVTSPERAEPLILHGSRMEKGQWPWAAALFVRKSDNTWKFQCGGTLVSDTVVVTAAHCVWRKPVKNMFIVLGHLSRKLPTANRRDFIHRVTRIYLLPVYRHKINKYNSNIAVLVLKGRLILSTNILPACLPDNDTVIHPYTMSIVSGWGLKENQEISQGLNYMKVPIIDVMRCLQKIDKQLEQYVSYTTFCAGYVNGTAVCNEDGGGGLLTQHDGKWVLQGVLSRFSQPCEKSSYSVYTKVMLYTYWIKLIVDFENSKMIDTDNNKNKNKITSN